jgi:DNA-binding FrmR family transcriptional regulator
MRIDPDTLDDVVRRLRRAQGQIGGIIQMIEDGRDCQDLVTQLAAASRALDRAGFKIVATGLAECLRAEKEGSEQAVRDREQIERLFLTLA